MKVFLVRHAEGENSNVKWQTPKTPLSLKGKKQAESLSVLSRFKHINMDVILSSKWRRAQETAEIVAEALSKPIETLDGIAERAQSSKVYGLSRNDPVSEQYLQDCIQNRNDWNWKWDKEEESFAELFKRAIKFKEYLIKTYPQKNVMVFSHDAFLSCFITACILEGGSEDNSSKKLFSSIALQNAGISMLIYREVRKSWKLWYLNDYSYL